MIIVAAFSCENDVGPIVLETTGPVSFSQDIQPIFDIHCVGCHDQSHRQIDLSPCCSYQELWVTGSGAPYVDPDNPTQSNLYRHLTGELSIMPPFGALPEFEINLILRWIQQEAPDN